MPYSRENRIHTRVNVYGGQAYNAFVAAAAIESIACVLVRFVSVFCPNYGYTAATCLQRPCVRKRRHDGLNQWTVPLMYVHSRARENRSRIQMSKLYIYPFPLWFVSNSSGTHLKNNFWFRTNDISKIYFRWLLIFYFLLLCTKFIWRKLWNFHIKKYRIKIFEITINLICIWQFWLYEHAKRWDKLFMN